MYDRFSEKKAFGWILKCKGNEIIILSGEGMGRAIVMDGMKVAAKIAFVDDMVRVNTIEGYAAQINFSDKSILIINEIFSD